MAENGLRGTSVSEENGHDLFFFLSTALWYLVIFVSARPYNTSCTRKLMFENAFFFFIRLKLIRQDIFNNGIGQICV